MFRKGLSAVVWATFVCGFSLVAGAGALSLVGDEASIEPVYSLNFDAETGKPAAAMQVDITYDPERLVFQEVLEGSAVSQADKNVFLNEIAPGRLRILVVGLNAEDIQSGEIGQIAFSGSQHGEHIAWIDSGNTVISDFYGNPIETQIHQAISDEGPTDVSDSSTKDGVYSSDHQGAPYSSGGTEDDPDTLEGMLAQVFRENKNSDVSNSIGHSSNAIDDYRLYSRLTQQKNLKDFSENSYNANRQMPQDTSSEGKGISLTSKRESQREGSQISSTIDPYGAESVLGKSISSESRSQWRSESDRLSASPRVADRSRSGSWVSYQSTFPWMHVSFFAAYLAAIGILIVVVWCVRIKHSH